jgi:membrane protein
MVAGCGALMLATLIAQTVLASVREPVLDTLGLGELRSTLATVNRVGLALVVLTVAFLALFRILPDAYVRWRSAILGSLLTAAMVLLGTWIFSTYLSNIAPRWLQGAIGAVAVFMLWSYYLAQVFLLGAALTRVSSSANGESLELESHAELAE